MKRYLYLILRKIFIFLIPVKSKNNFQIEHIGSFYGGYDIVVKDKIKHIISCGLGEDATFDIEAINKLRENTTVILIAHRLTTIKNCDKIFLLDKGQLISQGSYEELIKSSELFNRFASDY